MILMRKPISCSDLSEMTTNKHRSNIFELSGKFFTSENYQHSVDKSKEILVNVYHIALLCICLLTTIVFLAVFLVVFLALFVVVFLAPFCCSISSTFLYF